MVRPLKYDENNVPSELNDDEYELLLSTGWLPGDEQFWTFEEAVNNTGKKTVQAVTTGDEQDASTPDTPSDAA